MISANIFAIDDSSKTESGYWEGGTETEAYHVQEVFFICPYVTAFGQRLVCRPAGTASLFAPIQIFPEQDSITGFRFSLLYGKNAALTGLDLGLVPQVTGNFKGVQWGFVGIVGGEFLGWQSNLVSFTEGKFTGLQTGAVNIAERVEGIQFGFINYTGTIHGIQIGLVNIIRQGGFLPVCIIVNGAF